MSAISDALFPPQGGAPAMKYKLSVQANPAIKRVTGTIDGESISMLTKEYSWPASNREIDLRVEPTDGGNTPIGSYSGVWAIFRLLSSADDHKVGTNLFPLVYLKAEGAGSRRQPILQDRSPIMFEVMQYPNDVRQAFDKDFFTVSCPKQVFE
jgi:type VI protein secretion system component VasK